MCQRAAVVDSESLVVLWVRLLTLSVLEFDVFEPGLVIADQSCMASEYTTEMTLVSRNITLMNNRCGTLPFFFCIRLIRLPYQNQLSLPLCTVLSIGDS